MDKYVYLLEVLLALVPAELIVYRESMFEEQRYLVIESGLLMDANAFKAFFEILSADLHATYVNEDFIVPRILVAIPKDLYITP